VSHYLTGPIAEWLSGCFPLRSGSMTEVCHYPPDRIPTRLGTASPINTYPERAREISGL